MASTPPPNRFHRSDRSQDSRSPISQTTMTAPTSPTSSTAADLEACASFLEEVDAWLVRINKRVAELEHRHKKHLSGEGWEWMAKYRGDGPQVDEGDDRVSERCPADVRKK